MTNPEQILLQKLLAKMYEVGCRYAVLEVTSHGLDQERVSGINFDIGVLTNISHEHLDYHKTFANYIKAKSKLFRNSKLAILNQNDSSVAEIKKYLTPATKVIGYQEKDLWGRIGRVIKDKFPEKYNRMNALAAFKVAKSLGIANSIILQSIKQFAGVKGRMEEIKNNKGFRIIIDFAHTPNALTSVLKTLKNQARRNLIAVFGCAGERDKAKRSIMGTIASQFANFSIFTAEDPRSEDIENIVKEMVKGAVKSGAKKLSSNIYFNKKHYYSVIPERGEAISFAIQRLAHKDDIVVVCGKGHEKSMAYGKIEYPWSDHEAIEIALVGGVKTIFRKKLGQIKKIHFTGIKGVAMTALALCAQDLNLKVTGSDTKELFVTDDVLAERGISWSKGFRRLKLWKEKLDLLVTTGAHGGMANPEVISAQKRGIPTMMQGEALNLFSDNKKLIVTCGVGGKTTTASMIAALLDFVDLKPSYAIGVGKIFPQGFAGKFDPKGQYFICEGDEFAVSPGFNNCPKFSVLSPKVVVVTNIEHDHPDIYPTINETKNAFKEFFRKIPQDGLLIASFDSKVVRQVIEDLDVPVQTYGFADDSDWVIRRSKIESQKNYVEFSDKKGNSFQLSLNVPGKYNARNAIATFILGNFLGLSSRQIISGLEKYQGCQRRFEKVGLSYSGILIYDDYAHHPAEIKSVLLAAKEWFPGKRIVAIFQPHTFSRTKALFKEFAKSFKEADLVGLMDIYSSAREKPDEKVNSKKLAEEVSKYQKEVYHTGDHQQTLNWVKKFCQKDDVVFTLGAGDIFYLHKKMLTF